MDANISVKACVSTPSYNDEADAVSRWSVI